MRRATVTAGRGIETLESRRLMAAILAGQTLRVTGDAGGNNIVVNLRAGDATKLDVKLDGTTTTFASSAVKTIVINTLGGSDYVVVRNVNGVVAANVRVNAGAGNDTIFTTTGKDTIVGGDGNDVVQAGSGRNRVSGNAGADIITTGGGNDVIWGGADHDVVYANGGNDTIFGGDGDDLQYAGAGDDVVLAGGGYDYVAGGDGNDTIFGQSGPDTVDAGNGNDLVFGGGGKDTLNGNAGNDVLWGGAATDVLSAGGDLKDKTRVGEIADIGDLVASYQQPEPA